MWVQRRMHFNRRPLWVVHFVLIFLQTSIGSSSPGQPSGAPDATTNTEDGVQRIGVGEVLIVDEFGREARSYWDAAAAEEKVETVTVYGGMEVASGGSSNDGGPDVVKGHSVKDESSEEESPESDLPGQNSIKGSALETTLLDCVLHGDLPCIQKKAFRALQKLIQMSNPGSLPTSTVTKDHVSSKESDERVEKVDKGVLQSPGWWGMGGSVSGATSSLKPENTVVNPVDEVIKAVSSNGGMSRLLEEVRDLVVDLVSNVISLQEDEEDRMRKMEKRSGEDGNKKRRRRSVVAKKEAGPVPLDLGSGAPSTLRVGEKTSVAEQEGVSGKGVNPTSMQRGGGGGGGGAADGGGKKKRRTGMNSILMGIMTLKSIFSYIGMVFSQVLQLKQLGLTLLTFIVSVVKLVILLRQQNNEKQPVADTKVVYLRPQYTPSHYGEHLQPQHYGGEHYKRSFDATSDPDPSDTSAHELAYSAHKP